MTRAGRRLVVLGAVPAVAVSLSGCKVLQSADSTSAPPITAAANAVAVPPAGSTAACPLRPSDVDAALGGRWTVSSLPSGGCDYSRDGRTILVSTVPLPKDAAGRVAALAQVRKPCDAASTLSLPMGAFVCRQDTLLEAATISGDHLLIMCTVAGSDTAQLPGRQAQLRTLVGSVAP